MKLILFFFFFFIIPSVFSIQNHCGRVYYQTGDKLTFYAGRPLSGYPHASCRNGFTPFERIFEEDPCELAYDKMTCVKVQRTVGWKCEPEEKNNLVDIEEFFVDCDDAGICQLIYYLKWVPKFPSGSYRKSCEECKIDTHGKLTCFCRKDEPSRSNSYRKVSLQDLDKCTKVSNQNGYLICGQKKTTGLHPIETITVVLLFGVIIFICIENSRGESKKVDVPKEPTKEVEEKKKEENMNIRPGRSCQQYLSPEEKEEGEKEEEDEYKKYRTSSYDDDNNIIPKEKIADEPTKEVEEEEEEEEEEDDELTEEEKKNMKKYVQFLREKFGEEYDEPTKEVKEEKEEEEEEDEPVKEGKQEEKEKDEEEKKKEMRKKRYQRYEDTIPQSHGVYVIHRPL